MQVDHQKGKKVLLTVSTDVVDSTPEETLRDEKEKITLKWFKNLFPFFVKKNQNLSAGPQTRMQKLIDKIQSKNFSWNEFDGEPNHFSGNASKCVRCLIVVV